MITLPFETTGQWSVRHGQDFLADIVNTRNMDFNRPGFARIAKKPTVLYTEDDDEDFGVLVAIAPISSGTSTTYYFITSNGVFSWDASTSDFDKLESGSPTLGLDSDGVIFNGILHVSGGTKVGSYASGSWTDRITGIGTTYPHPLCALDFQPYLALGYGNTVKLYDTSYSLKQTCTLPAEYIVTGIRSINQNIYIATRHIAGNAAKLFVWNGSGTVAQAGWNAKANWIYSLADFDSSVVILTSLGQLLRFNGGGFDELAHLPVYDTPYSWTAGSSLSNGIGQCANRGMIHDGGVLYLNIDGSINSSASDAPGPYLENQPSGLWAYDPAVGLYHKGGYCNSRYNEADITFASSHFVFASPHNLKTGDPVYPTDTTGLTGISADRLYYAIVDNATSILLANNKADALAGRHISITGTTSSTKLIIDTFDSVGATYTTVRPGAVGLFITSNPPSILGSDLMYGGTATKPDGTAVNTLMSFGASHGVGSFTTSPVPASGVLDTFQKLYSFVDNFALEDAELVIKHRTAPRYGLPTQYAFSSDGKATWTDDTHFTIDTTAKDFSGVEEGDEIEIIEGAGAGYTAHIASIDKTSSTYAVEIDEAIPGVSNGDTSEVIANNWKKIAVINGDSPTIFEQFAETAVGASSTYSQFKLELRGIDVSVRKLNSVNAPKKPSV